MISNAIVPPGSAKEQVQFMFRSLLLERFQLIWHRDSREVAAYSLAVYKGAPKLKAHVEVSSGEDSVSSGAGGRSKLAQGPDGFPVLPSSAFAEGPVTIVRNGRARLQAMNGATAQLAGTLSGHLGSLIVDETGLTGRYDFTLYWTPDEIGPLGRASSPPADSQSQRSGDSGLAAALQQQLGLRLTSKRQRVETIVVDRMEKAPIGN